MLHYESPIIIVVYFYAFYQIPRNFRSDPNPVLVLPREVASFGHKLRCLQVGIILFLFPLDLSYPVKRSQGADGDDRDCDPGDQDPGIFPKLILGIENDSSHGVA